jgi:hypothetical protein
MPYGVAAQVIALLCEEKGPGGDYRNTKLNERNQKRCDLSRGTMKAGEQFGISAEGLKH